MGVWECDLSGGLPAWQLLGLQIKLSTYKGGKKACILKIYTEKHSILKNRTCPTL
jgi:hypothetical protein